MMAGPLTIIADGRVLNGHTLTCSNTDPGGYQALSLKAPGADLVAPDAPVRVLLGADTVWHGLVNEPGAATRDTRADDELAAVGMGARLKDSPFSMIYADPAFNGWKGPTTTRQLVLLAASWNPVTAGTVETDVTSGGPALKTAYSDTGGAQVVAESIYDAGDGNTVAKLYYAWLRGSNVPAGPDATFWQAAISPNDGQPWAADYTGDLQAAGPGSGLLTAAVAARFAAVQAGRSSASGTGGEYPVYWTALCVYGDHGLPLRGTASASQGYGLYPHDIWGHALRRSGAGILPGRVDDASGYIVRQAVYREAPATGAEQIMGDMATIMGWHTGVWAPSSAFDAAPRADLCAPPPAATCVAYRRECDDFASPKIRRDTLYTRAEVRYTDTAGSLGVQAVELPSDLIDGDRTLQVNMGTGSAGAAQAYGRFALLLARDSARGGGSCTVGDTVHLPGGGRKPAMLLRAGRDRIQIPDLPDSGPMTGPRRDTFLVRRVETTIANGRAQTRIEFDGGADLMEVLQARMAGALEAANL
jgi:hypothetical protein